MRFPRWISRIGAAFVRMSTSIASNPRQWFVDWARGGNESDSGVPINGATAASYAPVWYAINKIGGHVGQLPLVLYERVGEEERRKARRHPSYSLAKMRPNEFQTAMYFRETLQHHALLWGNGRAAILRNRRNDPVDLIPLLPDRWDTAMIDGQKWHVRTVNGDEFDQGIPNVLPDREVLHIPGLGYDGIKGYSVIHLARNSWGLGLAAEKHMNRHFANNAVPSIVLHAPPGAFKKEADAKDFLDGWNRRHGALDEAGKAGLLREGITAQTMGIPGKDAQWVEQRKFQRQEAALWMLLEQILGDDSSVSYNSLEAKNLAYLVNCLMRWLLKWETECNAKLLTKQQRSTESHFFKFTTAGLLRGTQKERFEVYQVGRQIGALSAEEVRTLEDWGPKNPGHDYSNPAITPGDGSDDEASTTDPQDRLRGMVENRLRKIFDCEAEKIISAAGRKGNFLQWVQMFYQTFTLRLVESYEDLGGTREQAESHAAASQYQVVTIAGESHTDTLVTNLQVALDTWSHRATTAAEKIITYEVTR